MARLYSLIDATEHHDPEFGHFTAGPDGGFMFPDELSDRLVRVHVGGRPAWETDISRQDRLAGEELDRRRDPASLYEAVRQLMDLAAAGASTAPQEPEQEPAKRGPGRPRRAATA